METSDVGFGYLLGGSMVGCISVLFKRIAFFYVNIWGLRASWFVLISSPNKFNSKVDKELKMPHSEYKFYNRDWY